MYGDRRCAEIIARDPVYAQKFEGCCEILNHLKGFPKDRAAEVFPLVVVANIDAPACRPAPRTGVAADLLVWGGL